MSFNKNKFKEDIKEGVYLTIEGAIHAITFITTPLFSYSVRHLSIVIPTGKTNLTKVVGAREIFDLANEYYVSNGRDRQFAIQFVGEMDDHHFISGSLIIRPDVNFQSIKKTDLIIIPAMDDLFEELIEKNERLTTWIKDQYMKGASVAGMCTGAFLLASTGLLDRKQCTTHWWAADKFRELFPSVRLVTDKIITDENRLYTSGGAFSSFNLLLHLVEKYYDRSTAVACSKILQIDLDRKSQSPYVIFAGQKEHDDTEILKAQDFIERNIGEKLSVEQLATELSISTRNFIRRFKKATHNTPIEYIQRVKIEAAKRMLENSRKTVREIMYDVGYSDLKAFRTIFKRVSGLSPIDYRNKFLKS